MANYFGVTRTNYFKVTDAQRLEEIVAHIGWSDCAEKFFAEEKGYYAFGAYGSLAGYKKPDGEFDDNVDTIYEELQHIVSPETAIIITEIGNENLRYLNANSVVITSNSIRYVNLDEEAILAAQEELGDNDYEPKMCY